MEYLYLRWYKDSRSRGIATYVDYYVVVAQFVTSGSDRVLWWRRCR